VNSAQLPTTAAPTTAAPSTPAPRMHRSQGRAALSARCQRCRRFLRLSAASRTTAPRQEAPSRRPSQETARMTQRQVAWRWSPLRLGLGQAAAQSTRLLGQAAAQSSRQRRQCRARGVAARSTRRRGRRRTTRWAHRPPLPTLAARGRQQQQQHWNLPLVLAPALLVVLVRCRWLSTRERRREGRPRRPRRQAAAAAQHAQQQALVLQCTSSLFHRPRRRGGSRLKTRRVDPGNRRQPAHGSDMLARRRRVEMMIRYAIAIVHIEPCGQMCDDHDHVRS
jgi:hypothetical protein